MPPGDERGERRMLSEERLDELELHARRHHRMPQDDTLDLIAAARRERALVALVRAAGPWPRYRYVQGRSPAPDVGCLHCHAHSYNIESVRHIKGCSGQRLAAWLAEHGGEG